MFLRFLYIVDVSIIHPFKLLCSNPFFLIYFDNICLCSYLFRLLTFNGIIDIGLLFYYLFFVYTLFFDPLSPFSSFFDYLGVF